MSENEGYIERFNRLEEEVRENKLRLKQIERRIYGENVEVTTNVTSVPHVAEIQKSTADALIGLGGTNPNAEAPPRRREPDFNNESHRPIPRKQTQSHYGGWVDENGNPLLDENGRSKIIALNWAQQAWGFFKTARGHLRRWSKGNRRRENEFMFLDISLRAIMDEIEDEIDKIDTRRIIEVVQKIEDFLKPLPRQHHEIDGVWKNLHFIRGLFE